MPNNFLPHTQQAIEDREQLKFKADVNNDNAVNVISSNMESLLDQIIDGLEAILDELDITTGEGYFNSIEDSTDPGNYKVILSETVPIGIERGLTNMNIVCRQEGAAYIYVDSVLIGSVRTGAASPNAQFSWSPKYLVNAGSDIEVQFKARAGSPIVDVDCHLQAIDKNI